MKKIILFCLVYISAVLASERLLEDPEIGVVVQWNFSLDADYAAFVRRVASHDCCCAPSSISTASACEFILKEVSEQSIGRSIDPTLSALSSLLAKMPARASDAPVIAGSIILKALM